MENYLNFIGTCEIDEQLLPLGMLADDRRRHMYVLGKSGMGKSTLLENMILQDILAGHGVGFIDPLGDSAMSIIDKIPGHRQKDVVYFNPMDLEYPMGINILEAKNEDEYFLVASNILSVMQKIWVGAWSPRMEYILLNTLLALLEVPGNNFLGVLKMFLDKDFRQFIANKCKNITVRSFWLDEYPRFSASYANEAIASVQNKVGQFFASSMVRNILGTSQSKINFRQIMDEKKIFIANLARGKIGEHNASMLGGFLLSQFEISALSRVDIAQENRQDFFLYLDEFHDLVSPSFSSILSQARKYRLNLTFANQYLGQLINTSTESDAMQAIFGNVGTMVTFQTSTEDAETLAKEMTPVPVENFPKLNLGQAYARMYVQGQNLDTVFISTFPKLFKEFSGATANVVANSRAQYARSRSVVEKEVSEYYLQSTVTTASGEKIKFSQNLVKKIQKNKQKGENTHLISGIKNQIKSDQKPIFKQNTNQNISKK